MHYKPVSGDNPTFDRTQFHNGSHSELGLQHDVSSQAKDTGRGNEGMNESVESFPGRVTDTGENFGAAAVANQEGKSSRKEIPTAQSTKDPIQHPDADSKHNNKQEAMTAKEATEILVQISAQAWRTADSALGCDTDEEAMMAIKKAAEILVQSSSQAEEIVGWCTAKEKKGARVQGAGDVRSGFGYRGWVLILRWLGGPRRLLA